MDATQRKNKIRQAFDAFGQGDSVPLMELYDDNVIWTIIGSTKFSGTYNGMQEVIDRLLGPIGALIDGHMDITLDNLIAEGDFVVAQGQGKSRTVAGGTYNNVYCWVYHWQNEKVIAVTEYLDTEKITESFGSS